MTTKFYNTQTAPSGLSDLYIAISNANTKLYTEDDSLTKYIMTEWSEFEKLTKLSKELAQ